MRYLLILLFSCVLCACRGDSDINRVQIENQFETVSAEQSPTEIKAFRACIDNPDCAGRDAAMADLGITILSAVNQDECQWVAGSTGALTPVALGSAESANDTAPPMSLDEWVARGSGQAPSLVIDDSLLKPFEFYCDFDDQSDEFQEGYDLLVQATAAGRKDAASEIGWLSINDPDLFDLAYARSILEPCHAAGGGFCALNLARIESLEADDGCGRCLGLLRIAAARTEDKAIRFMYALAKSRLGRGEVVGPVFFDRDTDGETQAYLAEFDMMFPNLALKATLKPPAP